MGSRLHIVADENIVLAEDFFAPFGTITLLRGNAIEPSNLRLADVLLVRSVTPVNSYLLSECRQLKFVGSATAGTDHVDVQLLARREIHFAHAPGSNAQSVAEYVLAAVLQRYPNIDQLAGLRVGVVGLGHTGNRVARVFSSLGCSVIANDPPLLDAGGRLSERFQVADLESLLEMSDVISIHVPLTTTGRWPTRSLIESDRSRLIRPGSLFINTSRGEVVTGSAVMALQDSEVDCVLDVWPGEPTPEPHIVQAAFLATPHIAGYSFDGKIKGTEMLRDALANIIESEEAPFIWDQYQGVPALPEVFPAGVELATVVRSMYSIKDDDTRFRDSYLSGPEAEYGSIFTRLRKDYPVRRSFDAFSNQWNSVSRETRRQLDVIVEILKSE
ncbi:MAG: 4-phosphoerythronate dehydrogenase [Rhodothermales bacterium]|nr:4-phosphoerythronate dehydrogenase [Rhodothermales bacterium]